MFKLSIISLFAYLFIVWEDNTVLLLTLFCAGSVFILKNKSTSSGSRLEVYRVYPIIGSFSISMSQTQRPRGRTDLPPDSSSPLVQSPSGTCPHATSLT